MKYLGLCLKIGGIMARDLITYDIAYDMGTDTLDLKITIFEANSAPSMRKCVPKNQHTFLLVFSFEVKNYEIL